jgi:predicted phage baseplate assembly protein
VLAEAPLTHVPARTSTGSASTLEVRVNDLLWQEVDFLYGHGPDEHVYTTRDDDAGRTHVRFGDGRTGARLPTGQENVRARYRKGMGAEGVVRERQLSLLQTKPLGVREVVNPVDAGDAAEADGGDAIRHNAPLPIQTLDRIVSLRDHEDFARAFSGIAKALATWTWNGYRRGVFLTVAGDGGTTIVEGGLTHANLMAAIAAAGDPAVTVRARSYTPAFFRLTAGISVDPAYESDRVLAAVESALRATFAFDAREFGQPVAKSEVVAAMQAVPGVVAVDLDELRRTDVDTPLLSDTLLAGTPRAGTDVIVGAELLLLDPRPVALQVIA